MSGYLYFDPIAGLLRAGMSVPPEAPIAWEDAWRAGRFTDHLETPEIEWEPAVELARGFGTRFPEAVAWLAWASRGTAWIATDARSRSALNRALCSALAPHVRPPWRGLLQRAGAWQETATDRARARAAREIAAGGQASELLIPRPHDPAVLAGALAADALLPGDSWEGVSLIGPLINSDRVADALARAWQTATPDWQEVRDGR